MYLPRSDGGNRSAAAAKLLAMRIPPPTPMTAREAMSWFMDWLKPAGIEPIMKIARPRTKKILRPKMSASLPAMGIAIAEATR